LKNIFKNYFSHYRHANPHVTNRWPLNGFVSNLTLCGLSKTCQHLSLNSAPPPKKKTLIKDIPDFLGAFLLYIVNLSVGVETYLKVVENEKKIFLLMFCLEFSNETQ
jgi:hypothetical protein